MAEQQKKLNQLESAMSQPGFWDNPVTAQEQVGLLKNLKAVLVPYQETGKSLQDLTELFKLVEKMEDKTILAEIETELKQVVRQVVHLETQSYLGGPHDQKNVFLNIHAGTGGTDACDWAEMLLRMYLKWLAKNNYSAQLIDTLGGDSAGLRRATVYVKGLYAFGYLKSEIGVHRLVRISPFDANKRRHTSFAAVDIVPETEETQVELLEKDLNIDTFRAGGAGGQHVNVTDSAVRVTHLPTGIVVQCQNERSQGQNKQTALKLLTAKLYALKIKEQEESFKKIYESKGEIAWGYQIRSYVLQPYTLVKDHRTGAETGKVQSVLDGELDLFIEAYLKSKKK